MKFRSIALFAAALLAVAAASASAQSTNDDGAGSAAASAPAQTTDRPAAAALAALPWEYGPFFQGGTGLGSRSDFTLLSAGFRLGKVITDPHLPGILRGQFEYAGELMPYWQAFTPPPHIEAEHYRDPATGLTFVTQAPVGGGTYTGFSITPIILRWHLRPHRRIAPWVQAAGGLVYTTHKFPPDVLVSHGSPGGTSVWNFTPQGGGGIQYFLSPGHSLMFAANGIHISSSSLGDHNPGVNASLQFQIGYTWWSRH